MSQAILNQILDQLPALEPSELKQLQQALHEYLGNNAITAEQIALHQALIASGLVRQVKQPIDPSVTRLPLIDVQGKPVSQTIIEERC
ncbi:MAG: hypothetical protein MUF49_17630 [Oculatellaceae cyanobacterium Prado106]|jgi:hypothetical protein|nr:hypothetical protein [Oculatellaceae cyanobacterium Prado106]